MSKILVVDDEEAILDLMSVNLAARGYEVGVAATGAQALEVVAAWQPDLIVLDLGLPDIDGLAVIRQLRSWSAIPIIVLSARHAEDIKVAALDAGVNDYVSKPFGMDELVARIRSALRWGAPAAESPLVVTDDFTIDLSAPRVWASDGEIRLTATEWHLVQLLVRNPDRLVTHRELLEEVWGPHDVDKTNYLRVYMASMRRKLEPDPAHPRYFRTVPGMGFRFEPGPRPPVVELGQV